MKAVIVDFDGTLFALRTDYLALRRALEDEVPDLFPPGTADRAGAVSAFLESASQEQRAPVLSLMARYEADGRARGEFFPDAREFIAKLAERGARFAVYTRNCRVTVETAFADAGLPPPHALVAIDDDVPPKPHPRATELLLLRLGVPAAGCVMVGDSAHDMRVGAALGIPRVLRMNPQLPVPPDDADLVVRSLADIDLDALLHCP